MQHLRRLKFVPERVLEADRASMVTGCVSTGMGFWLLTPTLLIDGLVEHMGLRILLLPIAGLSRTLTVGARDCDLQSVPATLANKARDVLIGQINGLMESVGLDAIDVD
jgi:DNA-binding transcriptional LysR family regulator